MRVVGEAVLRKRGFHITTLLRAEKGTQIMFSIIQVWKEECDIMYRDVLKTYAVWHSVWRPTFKAQIQPLTSCVILGKLLHSQCFSVLIYKVGIMTVTTTKT